LVASPVLVEFATVGRTKDGKIYHHLWGADEIDALLKEHGLAKENDESRDAEIR
jgi:20S proteasome subunit alpha 3